VLAPLILFLIWTIPIFVNPILGPELGLGIVRGEGPRRDPLAKSLHVCQRQLSSGRCACKDDGVTKKDPSAADGPAMSAEALAAFLGRPLIARLATSVGDQPRILPMWFRWDGSSVWMETSPTFRNYEILRQNPRAAVAIDESLGGLRLRAVIMRGTVEIIDAPEAKVHDGVREIYRRYLAADEMDGVGEEMLTTARHVLLRFEPATMITWDSVPPHR
jgi:nitroimidazol reductase NimA-like FMN-containing flavoprotein (pyridoxamine 5'-phosphate oxidase superfamily)